MSRVGKAPIDIPSGVEVKIDGAAVSVKGKQGSLTRSFNPNMAIEQKEGKIYVSRPDDSRPNRALHGTTRSLLNNMVIGVNEGFQKKLLIQGVGYRAVKKGKGLEFSLGYSHTINVDPPAGIVLEVPSATEIHVKGIDKETVGQVAANIRSLRKPEPYKGKGIRYENEHVRRKAGKTIVK